MTFAVQQLINSHKVILCNGTAYQGIIVTREQYKQEIIRVRNILTGQPADYTIIVADRIHSNDRFAHFYIWLMDMQVVGCWNNTNHNHPNHLMTVLVSDAIKSVEEKLEKYFA